MTILVSRVVLLFFFSFGNLTEAIFFVLLSQGVACTILVFFVVTSCIYMWILFIIAVAVPVSISSSISSLISSFSLYIHTVGVGTPVAGYSGGVPSRYTTY